MPKPQEIRTLVDQFVSDLSARVREQALDSVRAALGEGGAPKRRGPGRPRKAAKRGPGRPRKAGARRGPGRPPKAGRRARRSSADLEATSAKVLAYVRSNAGQRLEEIGKGLRTATAGLKRPIQVLVAAGKLRTEGQKRGTRYFAGGRKGRGKAKAAKKAGRKGAKRKARRAPRRSKATKAGSRRRAARKAPRRASKRARVSAPRKAAKSRLKAPGRRKITKKVRRVARKIRKALEPKPSAPPSVPLLPEPSPIL